MKVLKDLLQTVALCACIMFPASAETGKVFIAKNSEILEFKAPIDDASFFAMTTLYKSHKYTQVNMTSPGGDYDVGMKIAKFIYENKLKVYVPTYCASACTFAFFAANTNNRDIGDDAKLGLHNISFETTASNPNKTYVSLTETMEFAREVSRRTGMMMALYSTNGVPGNVLLEIAAKHGSQIVNVTREDLLVWGTIAPE